MRFGEGHDKQQTVSGLLSDRSFTMYERDEQRKNEELRLWIIQIAEFVFELRTRFDHFIHRRGDVVFVLVGHEEQLEQIGVCAEHHAQGV